MLAREGFFARDFYDRAEAAAYARRWALSRNPAYYDFDGLGGDCTNFVSQCLYAGCRVMNYSSRGGWYYISPARRSPSWTGVEPFYAFITGNAGAGPYGVPVPALKAGGRNSLLGEGTARFTTPCSSCPSGGEITSRHTYDALLRPLSRYSYGGPASRAYSGPEPRARPGADHRRPAVSLPASPAAPRGGRRKRSCSPCISPCPSCRRASFSRF